MKTLVTYLFICFLSTGLMAQRNYQQAINMGDNAFKSGDFQKSIDFYFAAEAFDENKKVEVQGKINIVLAKINTLKDEAEQAKQQAEIEREKAEDAQKMAQIEESKAKKAEQKSRKAEQNAIKQAEIAMQRELEAQKIKDIAAARVQANNAVRKINEGKLQNGAQEAILSYQLNKKAGGYHYNKDCYQALQIADQEFWKLANKGKEDISPIYQIQEEAVRNIATSEHKTLKEVIAMALEDKKVTIITQDKLLQRIKLGDRPRSMTFSQGGNILAVTTVSGELQVFHFNEKENRYTKKALFSSKTYDRVTSLTNIVLPNNSDLFFFSNQQQLYLGKFNGENERLSFRVQQSIDFEKIQTMAVSPDGQYLLVIDNNNLKLLKQSNQENSLPNYTLQKTISNSTSNIITTAAIGKGDNKEYIIALGFKNGRVNIADVNNLSCLINTTNCNDLLPLEHNISITKIIFNDNATQMVTASLDHTAKIWNLTKLEEDRIPLLGHKQWIWDVAYSYDQKQIFTASEDKTVKVWWADIETLLKEVKNDYDLNKQ